MLKPCCYYALTTAEIALMWQTAPPRMSIPPPGCPEADKQMSRDAFAPGAN
jgi:hypothetical protein